MRATGLVTDCLRFTVQKWQNYVSATQEDSDNSGDYCVPLLLALVTVLNK